MINTSNMNIDNHLNFLESEILVRVDSLKTDLDTMADELINNLHKKKIFLVQDINNFSEKLKPSLESFRIFAEKMSKKPFISEEEAAGLQAYTNQIRSYSLEYHNILQRINICVSEWSPSSIVIARSDKIVDQVDVKRFKTASPKIVRLSCIHKYFYFDDFSLNISFFKMILLVCVE